MRSPIQDVIASIHGECLSDVSGNILRGIPALEHVDPDSFGICLATADGYVYEEGDTRLPFCIQSISKPFTYGLALTDQGIDAVDAKIDVEPSGELYNEISLDPTTRRPRNPMINAGALVAASLVGGASPREQVERISGAYSAYAGRELTLDEDIFASQLESGHRNRAIGHMLREFGILEGDPNEAHEVYLRACSTMVTCRDLSLMGATLANDGVQPCSGERLLATELAERVLSVMSTCGMYDAAGRWVADVGMAAKSGVGGGIVAVLPGQLSIAAFSPPLDGHGNSVRAFKACRQLSRALELHAFHVPRAVHNVIRDSYDIVEAPSFVQRPEAERRVLEQHGHKARVYELHGDLLFAGAETVVRRITEEAEQLDFLVVDIRRVTDVADVARRLLGRLHGLLRDKGCEALGVDPDGRLERYRQVAGDTPGVFPTIMAATTYCEDRLISRYGDGPSAPETLELRQHPLLAEVAPRVLDDLERRLQPRSYADGELIVAEGDSEAGFFLILSGRVRSSLTAADGTERSTAVLTAGTCFGDLVLVTDTPHPIAMHAVGSVEALELTRAEFTRIAQEDRELWAALLHIFMFAIHNDVDRIVGSLASGRVAIR